MRATMNKNQKNVFVINKKLKRKLRKLNITYDEYIKQKSRNKRIDDINKKLKELKKQIHELNIKKKELTDIEIKERLELNKKVNKENKILKERNRNISQKRENRKGKKNNEYV